MANWETLEELMNKPLPLVGRDPFFHTQQFPKFMKRRTVLEKDNSIKASIQEENGSPKVRRFGDRSGVKNWLRNEWNSAEGDRGFVQVDDYDNAKDRQRLFTSISPKDKEFLGHFKHSVCPSAEVRSRSVRSKQKKEKLQECNGRFKAKNRDSEFIGILNKNILALLSGKSLERCTQCGLEKCKCKSEQGGEGLRAGEEGQETLILKVFDNLSKGKLLLDEIKEKKKMSSLRHSSINKKVNNKKMKISIDSGLMRYNIPYLKTKPSNLPKISTIYTNTRRHSSY